MKKYKFTINGNAYSVDIKQAEGNCLELEVNGTPYTVEMEKEIAKPKTPRLVRSKPADVKPPKQVAQGAKLNKVAAPLPGTIVALKVAEGDAVKKGDLLMIMEAMKMENNILAENDGVIKAVKVQAGQAVLQGDILVEVE